VDDRRQTRRVLSNDETGLLRFLGFMALAVAGFVYYWVFLSTGAAKRPYVGVSVFFIVSGVVTWFLTRLAYVCAGRDGVEIRTVWRRRQVPYTKITRVSSLPFFRMFVGALLLITITYRTRDGARRRVRFVGKHERCIRGVHPAVSFLREKAGIR